MSGVRPAFRPWRRPARPALRRTRCLQSSAGTGNGSRCRRRRRSAGSGRDNGLGGGVGGDYHDDLNDAGGGGTRGGASGGETKEFVSEVRRVFGHSGFRPGQREVIECAMAGRDVFVLMPTGGGKSLCYCVFEDEAPSGPGVLILTSVSGDCTSHPLLDPCGISRL